MTSKTVSLNDLNPELVKIAKETKIEPYLELKDESAEVFAGALLNPPDPNDAAKKAIAKMESIEKNKKLLSLLMGATGSGFLATDANCTDEEGPYFCGKKIEKEK